jgi:hypothetical protein
MADTLVVGGASTHAQSRAPAPRPDLVEWLRSGRLMLLDSERQPVGEEQWMSLPVDVRERTQLEFDRVVRGHSKAAVLFLK